MGSGSMGSSGRFRLKLSLRYDASPADVQSWKQSFQRASDILHDATGRRHQFGEIVLCKNSTGGDDADAWLDSDSSEESSSSQDGMGPPGLHMSLYDDARNDPFVIAHEFGHYAYDLQDEYDYGTGAPSCLGANGNACIMEALGRSEFCEPSNHDPDDDTWQTDINGESCWAWMQDKYPDLRTPTTRPKASIAWTDDAVVQKQMILIDCSDAMTPEDVDAAVVGAYHWVSDAEPSNRIGALNFSNAVLLRHPLSDLGAGTNRSDLESFLLGIQLGATPAAPELGAALRAGLDALRADGAVACTERLLLVTAGKDNDGVALEAEVLRLVAEGVNVDVVAICASDEAGLALDISNRTSGRFAHVDPALHADDEERERAIVSAVISVTQTTADNWSQIGG